jgi:glycosyltransferase involved in cell wall biosynthesis
MYHADLLGGLVARLAGVRHVCWGIRHTTLEPGSSKQSTIMVAKLCAKLSHWVPRRIVCCAQKAAEVHQAVGYVAEKCVVIPNGYDLTQFAPDQASGRRVREEWGIAPSTPLLGMVGRFDPQKDHGNLIQALGLLKQQGVEFRCALVGNGLVSANDELGGWLRRHDVLDRVLLVGRRNDIPAVMNALDLHVLSSAYGEAFPNVLAEAMACGTPCVTTDVGDAAVIVADTGWVVPPRNPQALAKAMVQAFKARQESTSWQARRQAARERVADKFSIERMVSAYRQVWQKAAIKQESS